MEKLLINHAYSQEDLERASLAIVVDNVPALADQQVVLLTALDKYLGNLRDGFGTIAPAALNDQLAAAKPFLLDVREKKEVLDNGKIADSVNIPTRTLFKSLDKLPQDKSAPIVVYCAIGHRGGMVMMALQLLGYTNVKSLASGFNAWKAANLPISK